MNCPKCGNELKTNMKFCAKCGATVTRPESNHEFVQLIPVAQQQKLAKQKKGSKKNLFLKITAIILIIAVLLTGGLFITDAILFKTESKKGDYITDFPVLKQKTDLLVYDAEKFPYEDYNIKVDRFKMGNAFKSSTFSSFKNIINERSNSKIFNIDFKEDGKYQITLEGIVSSRTQAVPTITTTIPANTEVQTNTSNSEELTIIKIIVVVDNDDKDAVDRVTINSKMDDEPIKEFDGVPSSQTSTDFIEATDGDFEKLGEMLQETVGSGYYGDDKSLDRIEELLCLLHSSHGSAYRYYYGDIEYKQYTPNAVWEAKVPKENIKWICENIFNIDYKETLDCSGMNWNDCGCYFKDDYLYITEWTATGFPYTEYELDSYKLTNGKYEAIFDVYEEDWNGDQGAVYAGKVKVTATIKIIDGERYWSVYKIEEYDLSSATPDADINNSAVTNVKVGDYITFGQYEQDNYTSNGKEPVEWLVLDVQDGKYLVISKDALDCKQYNEDYVDTTWENCTLRTWLNNDFYNTAFSSSEKNKICTTNVIAEDNFESGTEAGNDTQDKVFLLSISETEKYFSSDDARMCKPSKYAISKGVFDYVDSYEGNCWWWLRSPGIALNYASYIYGGGIVVYDGEGVDFGHAIRPAMWITIG